MTEKTKLCGFQPTGKSEDVPKPPQFNPVNNDKLEDHLLPYKKEMVKKIRDEKMQLVTADEFVKLHKESLTTIREKDKLQEQLNTTKKALTEIAEIIDDHIHECDYGCDNHCELNGSLNIYSVEDLKSVTESALAEIGKEGSGDE